MTQLSLITPASQPERAPRRRRAAAAPRPRRTTGVAPRLKLDERTRQLGLAHVAEARQQLAEMAARPPKRTAA
jgi:hypothetical protein